MEMTGQLHASVTPRERGPVPDWTGGCMGPQSMPEWFGEQINLLILPGIEPRFFDRPICNPVAIRSSYSVPVTLLLCISGLQNCLYFEENFLTVCHILPRRKEHYFYLCVSERQRRNEL